jgi:hypothetical protein
VHHVLVRDVRVGEHDLVDPLAAGEVGQRLLGDDRDAVGVTRSGERRRVHAVRDAGDLRGGEGDDARLGVITVDDVEVMEVAPAGAHHDQPAHGGAGRYGA